MKRDLKLIVAVLILSLIPAVLVRAQSDAENSVSEFDVNGLKVLVKRRPGTPTVSAGLFIRGGSAMLTAQNAGIEDLMLDVSTEASKAFPREALRKELARTATTMGYGTNNDYSVLSMASTKGNFDSAWRIFTDAILNPSFAPEDVERVRSRHLAALTSRSDSPDQFLQDAVEKTIFAGHPYANDPNGTPENISRFTPAELAAWHKQVMQTSRLLLVLVGDVDPANIQKLATASFGALPRGDFKQPAVPPLSFKAPSLDVVNRSLETDYIQGAFAAPSLADPDYYAMRVAMTALNESIFEEVRVKRNLSYAPNADMGTAAANIGFIYVTTTDPNQSVSVMLDQIRDRRDNEVTTDAIHAWTGGFLTSYYTNGETNAAQAGELARYELVGGGWRNAFHYLERIRAVTPEQVKAVSQKYMKNIRFELIGNPTGVNRSVFLPAL